MTDKKYVTIDYLITTYTHCSQDVISLLREKHAAGNSYAIWKTLFLWASTEATFSQIIGDCDPEDGYASFLYIHDQVKQVILEILCVADEIELQMKYGAAFLEPVR